MANDDHGQTETPAERPPQAHGSAPLWYTAEELRHYLKALRNYSDEIATELAADYARNLQLSFEKGWEMATRSTPNNRLDDSA